MYLYVYDSDFNQIALVDQYSSLIWTDRYDECGEFELVVPYQSSFLDIFCLGYYCKIDQSMHWAVIEKVEMKKDAENSAEMIVSGRSLESILERRVVMTKVEFENAGVQDVVKSLITTNIISPSDELRKIEGFKMNISTDTAIIDLKLTDSYDGDDLLSIVSGICQENNIGFIVGVSDDFSLFFQLYIGVDRSGSNVVNGIVCFSSEYDNLLNSSYYLSSEVYRNTIIVSTSENNYMSVSKDAAGFASDLARREIQIDVNDLKSNRSSSLSDKMIVKKAREKLNSDYKIEKVFEGDIIPNIGYQYMVDYFTGDIVKMVDIFGNARKLRIKEMVISYDEAGLEMTPSFEDTEE
jgi:hypothetical protein